jgi:hypothetical protein
MPFGKKSLTEMQTMHKSQMQSPYIAMSEMTSTTCAQPDGGHLATPAPTAANE